VLDGKQWKRLFYMKSPTVLTETHFMKRPIELFALLTLLLLFALSVAGQVNDQPAQPTSPKDRVTPTEEINATGQQQPIALRVSGANLRDNQGATIGRVEDLIVDRASGRIEFLIVSTFFPTNGTHLTPIPWKAISPLPEQTNIPGANQGFALNFPRTKLHGAPTFERYRWPDMGQAAWRQPIYQFYSARDNAAAGAPSSETEIDAGAGVRPDASPRPAANPALPSEKKPSQ
jgi:hypothetical protein